MTPVLPIIRGAAGRQADRVQDPLIHLRSAYDWTKRAQNASGDGGIPASYDPIRRRWLPSYPETTGYLIPTMLRTGDKLGDVDSLEATGRMADFLLSCRDEQGAIGHWRGGGPVVFDTAQVVLGWMALYARIQDQKLLDASVHAADWLVSVQDTDGAWRSFQYHDGARTIDTRTALALATLHDVNPEPKYESAAARQLEWAMTQTHANRWMDSAAFEPGDDPVLHTIAYTIEGMLRTGQALGNESAITHARSSALLLAELNDRDRPLRATYGPEWNVTDSSRCLTGLAQTALIWLRCASDYDDTDLVRPSIDLLQYVASTQHIAGTTPISGAVAGSWPIWGRYERFKYPNWAAKFFMDGLVVLMEDHGGW